jgi:hypothetical protein
VTLPTTDLVVSPASASPTQSQLGDYRAGLGLIFAEENLTPIRPGATSEDIGPYRGILGDPNRSRHQSSYYTSSTSNRTTEPVLPPSPPTTAHLARPPGHYSAYVSRREPGNSSPARPTEDELEMASKEQVRRCLACDNYVRFTEREKHKQVCLMGQQYVLLPSSSGRDSPPEPRRRGGGGQPCA